MAEPDQSSEGHESPGSSNKRQLHEVDHSDRSPRPEDTNGSKRPRTDQSRSPSPGPDDDNNFDDALLELEDDEQLRFLAQHLEQVAQEPKDKEKPQNESVDASNRVPTVERVRDTDNQQAQTHEQVQNQVQNHAHNQVQVDISGQEHDQDQNRAQKQGPSHVPSDIPSHLSSHVESQIQTQAQDQAANQVDTRKQTEHLERRAVVPQDALFADPIEQQIIRGDPLAALKVHTLPVLDNLSTQILRVISQPQEQILAALTEPESPDGMAFQRLLNLFNQTKLYYSEEPFLTPDNIGERICRSKKQRAVLQRTNLATFVCAILGRIEVGFFHLNQHFLDAFVAESGRLLKVQGALYLELKTQAFISALRQHEDPTAVPEQAVQDIVKDLFPLDMKEKLLARRKNAAILTPSESDFVSRCQRRRETLMMCTNVNEVATKYEWLTFIRDLCEYISKNASLVYNLDSLSIYTSMSAGSTTQGPPGADIAATQARNFQNQGAMAASRGHGSTTLAGPSQFNSTQQDAHNSGSMDPHSRASTSEPGVEGHSSAASMPPDQKYVPTGIYTGVVKAYPRRHWSREEEEALLNGLERVRGPYWSQILELHGAGGTISEVLKDRTQVQLKDKARNLKVAYIKSGQEVPTVLNYVTGDVKRFNKRRANPADNGPAQRTPIQQHQSPRMPPQAQMQSGPLPPMRAAADSRPGQGQAQPQPQPQSQSQSQSQQSQSYNNQPSSSQPSHLPQTPVNSSTPSTSGNQTAGAPATSGHDSENNKPLTAVSATFTGSQQRLASPPQSKSAPDHQSNDEAHADRDKGSTDNNNDAQKEADFSMPLDGDANIEQLLQSVGEFIKTNRDKSD